jgi:glycosyltransferase involved in cell wall biosynthesis
MATPLLTIAIPTRNRVGFLRDSLGALVEQILALPPDGPGVALHVSDNVSTDETPEVVRQMQARCPALTYHRNAENVGASRNVMACVRAAEATPYCWVVGDDELICPGAVESVLRALAAPDAPDLMVCFETGYDPRMPRPRKFPSYREYARACARENPHALVEHTLVSSNIFRTPLFDQKVAEETLATDYSHMYAVLSGLRDRGGTVLVSDAPVITVRQRRAPAVDGVWPTDLEASWIEYLNWQKREFDVPELNPGAAIEEVRRKLFRKITRHPFRYARDNLAALKDPRAIVWFLRRLIFHSARRGKK